MAFDGDQEEPPAFDPNAEADGVIYTTSEHAPELKLFRCEPYRATLPTKSCAARWIKAQEAYGDLGETLAKCLTCSVGSVHAGRGRVRYSRWFRSGICPRCGVGGARMVGNRLCVSDYNRQREMRAGRNARGHVPTQLLKRPLHRIEVFVEVDGEARRLVDRETCSLTETMIQVMRTTKGEIAFGWAGPGIQPAEAPTDDAAPELPPAPEPPEFEVCRYRAKLFATTALAQGGRAWGGLGAEDC